MKKQVFRRIFDQGQWNAKFAIPVSLLIYNRSFKYFSMGCGSVFSWVLSDYFMGIFIGMSVSNVNMANEK